MRTLFKFFSVMFCKGNKFNEFLFAFLNDSLSKMGFTVELQWLEHLSDHENMFETGVVRANEC